MPIRPRDAFKVCWELYQSIRGDLEGIPLLDPGKPPSDHAWRPNRGPRGNEFVADFHLACERSLEGPGYASRLILCRLYVIGMNPWQEVRQFMEIREDVAAMWLEEIEDRAGKEIMRRGLFPPRQYFGERSRPRRDAQRGPSQS